VLRHLGVPRTLAAPGLAVVLALLAAAAAVAIYQHNPGWMYDARVYRTGGSAVLRGEDLYRSFPPPAFTYTPFAALLFAPLSYFSVNSIGFLWTSLSMLCLEGCVWLALGRPPIGRSWRWTLPWAAAGAFAVWLDPISLTLLLGQVNLLLMFLVLLDLSLPDGSRFKGLGTGVAAGIKLTPAFFVLYLAATRRLRAATVAAACVAATAAIGFLALPADSLRYWGGTFLDSSRVGDPQNVRSQSLRSLLVRWAHTSQGVQPMWVALVAAVAVVALLLALWAHRRGEELLAVCMCATATLLISPITWQHHWVWMLPLLLWLVQRAWRKASRLLWGICGAIAVEFYARPYQWGVPVDRVADLHLGTVQLLQSSTYAATALLVLALAAVTLWRDGQAAAVMVSQPGRSTRRRLPPIGPEADPARK
jgi:alpha-1,2-mannosyltransferase